MLLAFTFLLLAACDQPRPANAPPDTETALAPAPAKPPSSSSLTLPEALAELEKCEEDILQLANDLRAILAEDEKSNAIAAAEAERLRNWLKPDATIKQLIAEVRNFSRAKRNARLDAALADLEIACETYLAQTPRLIRTAADAQLNLARADWLARVPPKKLLAHADALDEIRKAIVVPDRRSDKMPLVSFQLEHSAKFLRDSAKVMEASTRRDAKGSQMPRYIHDTSASEFVSREEAQKFRDEVRAPFVKEHKAKREALRQALLRNASLDEISKAREQLLAAAKPVEIAYSGESRPPNIQHDRLEVFARFWVEANKGATLHDPIRSMDHFALEFAKIEPALSKMASEMAGNLRAKSNIPNPAAPVDSSSNTAPSPKTVPFPDALSRLFDKVTDAASVESALKELEGFDLGNTAKLRTREMLVSIRALYQNPNAQTHLVVKPMRQLAELEFLNSPAAMAAKERVIRFAIAKRAESSRLLEPPLATRSLGDALQEIANEHSTRNEWEKVAMLLKSLADFTPFALSADLRARHTEALSLSRGQRSEKANDFGMAVTSYRRVLITGHDPAAVAFAIERLKEIKKAHPDALNFPSPVDEAMQGVK